MQLKGRHWHPRWLLARARRPVPRPTRVDTDLRLPDFLIIGAQKAGTTWMHQRLADHPGVFMPRPKELHFFDQRNNYAKGIGWYAEHYRHAPAGATLGEATPNYLWASDQHSDEWTDRRFRSDWKHSIPERARAWLGPRVPLLVMLRDPVERAVSAFYHHANVEDRLDLERPFRRIITGWGIAHMGFYAAHLERWYEVFDRDRFLVLVFEEVMRDPQAALDQVTDHIGVPRHALPESLLRERVHGGSKHLGPDGQYYFDAEHTRLAISHADLDLLREVYAPETARLASLLGRDLELWSCY